jgi:ribosome-binding factor A
MASRKLDHLNERIRHKLGMILLQESNDPRFRHVTITDVELSRDLIHARIRFSTYDALLPAPDAPRGKAAAGATRAAKSKGKPAAGQRSKRKGAAGAGDIDDLTEALNRASGYLGHALARTLETRISPKLSFVYDPTFDRVQEMENLLKPLREAGEMGQPEEESAAPAPSAHDSPDGKVHS